MTIKKINDELKTLYMRKDILKDKLDNAFMTGNMSDEEVEQLKTDIEMLENEEKNKEEDLIYLKEISKETRPLAGTYENVFYFS